MIVKVCDNRYFRRWRSKYLLLILYSQIIAFAKLVNGRLTAILRIGIFSVSILNCSVLCSAQDRNILKYDKPAANWNEALPIGNGRLGAMIFGGISTERLQLNENTVWAGGPNNTIDSAARPYVEQVRQLLKEKKFQEALRKAKESPDTGKPIRDFDLD